MPYSFDAEQAVLGSVLLDSSVMDVLERLNPEHFHVGLHGEIFAQMRQMFIVSKPLDIVTVIEETLKNKVFDTQEEAKKFLGGLSGAVSTLSKSSIREYAGIIEEKYLTRRLVLASKEIFEAASGGLRDTESLLDFAEEKIYDIRRSREIRGLTLIKPDVIDAMTKLTELAANPDDKRTPVTGLSTGFSYLDKSIFGLNKSDLIIIAGRPGMGKTTFAMNIAINAAKIHFGKQVAVFSLEMSRTQLVNRIFQAEAKITAEQMKTGVIPHTAWNNIREAAQILTQLGVYIDDSAGISIGEMKAKLRRMPNLGLVVIDYLQLMSTGRRDGNRVNEISELTRNLKVMAKDLNVPIILASQLSRQSEKRFDKDKRPMPPMLSDLRDSGSIEQDADIVVFLHRIGYYDPEYEYPNACECHIQKNRHGETTTIGLNFEGQFFKFTTAEYRAVDS
ncbi:MAG: replicative DNA helicase [Oscillospiraceae bacterium]|nr:replicative DNA helicase [Oscillospiraceae bacterium]